MWWNGAIVFFRVSSRGKQICCLEILQVSRVSNESTLCDCVWRGLLLCIGTCRELSQERVTWRRLVVPFLSGVLMSDGWWRGLEDGVFSTYLLHHLLSGLKTVRKVTISWNSCLGSAHGIFQNSRRPYWPKHWLNVDIHEYWSSPGSMCSKVVRKCIHVFGVNSKCVQTSVIILAVFCIGEYLFTTLAHRTGSISVESWLLQDFWGLVSEAKQDGADGLTSWMLIQAVRLCHCLMLDELVWSDRFFDWKLLCGTFLLSLYSVTVPF